MSAPLTQSALEAQLETRYGLLLTQKQLAQFLGRSIAGLRWTLQIPPINAPWRCATVRAVAGQRAHHHSRPVPG